MLANTWAYGFETLLQQSKTENQSCIFEGIDTFLVKHKSNQTGGFETGLPPGPELYFLLDLSCYRLKMQPSEERQNSFQPPEWDYISVEGLWNTIRTFWEVKLPPPEDPLHGAFEVCDTHALYNRFIGDAAPSDPPAD